MSHRAREAATALAESCQQEVHKKLSTEDYKEISGNTPKDSRLDFPEDKRLHKKFGRLQVTTSSTISVKPLSTTKEDPSSTNLRPQWIFNLMKRKLSQDEELLLSKGPRYAIIPVVKPVNFVAPLNSYSKDHNKQHHPASRKISN